VVRKHLQKMMMHCHDNSYFIGMLAALWLFFSANFGYAGEQPEVSREQIDEWMAQSAELYAKGEFVESVKFGRMAADHGNVWGQNNVAWVLATCRDPDVRDGKLAVQYALQAVEQQPNKYAFVRTLAAAYARNGEFDKAIAAQERANELFQGDKQFTDDMREQLHKDNAEKLALYQRHEAYIDDPEADAE